ncbi:DUF805 domain-containing protein [Sinisalibacter aestuarii]|uniref:Inner membrane protein YhaI n=1 Tax=Sinisalibacter aestuarii TaxID=2949426 RepID=A0ABQ5LMW8_9RHOB|nr:DUF805 domain-containing protein [Sinisalibacter aestuarii]GKY86303.1 inner membrane protein YhaI [Sinisalibacter aestuarii]
MTFGQSVSTCFSKYVTFSGRAQRSEFWWWVLFVFVANLVLSVIDSVLFGTTVTTEYGFEASTNTPILSGLFGLATLLPGISVAVRRLHDRDKSGWWYWLVLIPLVGIIILIVWFATEGTSGPNRYGEDPLGGGSDYGGGEGLTASSVPNVPRG